MFGRKKKSHYAHLRDAVSAILDTNWYLEQNPDVKSANIDPLTHFLTQGLDEGRLPTPLFDHDFYITQNPDIATAGMPAFAHYVAHGAEEGRSPHPLFDINFYRAAHPDITNETIDPLIHFITKGAQQNYNPHPLFNTGYYHQNNPGVAAAGINPLIHFLTQGFKEKLNPHPLFDLGYYLDTNRDVEEQNKNALIHYLSEGAYEGRNPHPFFDSLYYLENNHDVKNAQLNPLSHYLTIGAHEDRSPHILFDSNFYRFHYKDDLQDGISPLEHYATKGADQNKQPHPLFDPHYYTALFPDIQYTGRSPFIHFLDIGLIENRQSHPAFDAEYYLDQLTKNDQELPADDESPLIHFIKNGASNQCSAHPLFDIEYYLFQFGGTFADTANPLPYYLTYGALENISPNALFNQPWYKNKYLQTQNNINPFTHFLTIGREKNHNPNPFFLSAWYRRTYLSEDDLNEKNPLIHYVKELEVTLAMMQDNDPVYNIPNPNPWFDTGWYISKYNDISRIGINPLAHFILDGANEGRHPGPEFDPDFYLSHYGPFDNITPLQHFIEEGARLGYTPNPLWNLVKEKTKNDSAVSVEYDEGGIPKIDPRQYKIIEDSGLFDKSWYTERYLQESEYEMDPIEHYLIYGANIGYNPSQRFNSRGYRSINHDLRNADINPLLHYIQHGRLEGRQANRETRSDEVKEFRFSKPEYGPIENILKYDSDIVPPSDLKDGVCLHLHLFHTDMADEFCDIINNLQVPFTLLVSVQPDEDVTAWKEFFALKIEYANKIIVEACPNIGRDVQPWLTTFKDEIRKHTIFCHLHTKKSGYNKFQKSWRRYLIHTIFGAKTIVNQILHLLTDEDKVGLIFPAYFYILRDQPNYGKNYNQYEQLYATLFGDIPPEKCPDYPAGSFFWARTDILEPLFDLDMLPDDFEEEKGQVDGTIAHALERILGALPMHTGYESRCIAIDVPFDLTRYVHPARVPTFNSELFLEPPTHHCDQTNGKNGISAQIAHNLNKTDPVKKLNKKIAVYTAITGGYENLVKPLVIDPDIDYFVLTDTPELFNPDWATVIECPYKAHTPVRTARYIKTHPHFWFADYDYAIWIDANVLPAASLKNIVHLIDQSPYHAGFIEHPLRYNFMEEGNELIKFGLDNTALIEEQMIRYGRFAKIFKQELIETNLFICRPKLQVTKDFLNAWWRELNNYSHRDQLSINFALMQSDLKWMSLFEDNISLRDHPDFFLLEHELQNRDVFIEKITRSLSDDIFVQEAS